MPAASSKVRWHASGLLLSALGVATGILSFAAPQPAPARPQGCAEPPASPLVVNVGDKGARGDGHTDDTEAIQEAIDEIAGTGGTVLVPDGTYLIDAASKRRLRLKSDMTLKLSDGATLKAMPTHEKKYAVLSISDSSNVTVTGGTLRGERDEHIGKKGEWGMGIEIEDGAEHITISGVTARAMWGDGFYINDASDVTLCAVTADRNRRQGLSIVEADGVFVTNSIFQNTGGTRPGAGIDLEPNDGDQEVTRVRIERSKFLNNAGGGIQLGGKKGRISKVEIARNLFIGNRPILVENAPAVRSSAICDNRFVGYEQQQASELNAFADPVEVVALQSDCRDGQDLRFEVNRQKKKKRN
jgi:hypothetical protein